MPGAGATPGADMPGGAMISQHFSRIDVNLTNNLPIPCEPPIPGGALWPGKLPKPGGRPYDAFPSI